MAYPYRASHPGSLRCSHTLAAMTRFAALGSRMETTVSSGGVATRDANARMNSRAPLLPEDSRNASTHSLSAVSAKASASLSFSGAVSGTSPFHPLSAHRQVNEHGERRRVADVGTQIGGSTSPSPELEDA